MEEEKLSPNHVWIKMMHPENFEATEEQKSAFQKEAALHRSTLKRYEGIRHTVNMLKEAYPGQNRATFDICGYKYQQAQAMQVLELLIPYHVAELERLGKEVVSHYLIKKVPIGSDN
jgi:hypothetical protein